MKVACFLQFKLNNNLQELKLKNLPVLIISAVYFEKNSIKRALQTLRANGTNQWIDISTHETDKFWIFQEHALSGYTKKIQT